MASLREVASHAGVSVATAWRVATGTEGVRPALRERVERSMRELLYVLPSQRPETGVIGLLIPQLSNPVFPAIAAAMETRASAMGVVSILCNTAGSADREAEYVHMLLKRQVDGMVFIAGESSDLRSDHAHYRRLLDEGARLVFVNSVADDLGAPSVGVDPHDAGRQATQHLIDLGHERIGYVAGPAHYTGTREQGAGRRDALVAAALDPDAHVSHDADDFSFEAGARGITRLLDGRGPKPSGVICNNDLMAVGVLHELAARRMQVPVDMSVVGFDGIDFTSWTRPSLTTMEQPIDDIASTAIDALQTMISEPGRTLPRSSFRARLRVGGSSAAPRSSPSPRRPTVPAPDQPLSPPAKRPRTK